MRRFVQVLILLLLSCPLFAQKVRFMPQWTPQAQFAGYYVALEKGFYADEGLDVEIVHLSATTRKNALSHLKSGDVDITMAQPFQAMAVVDGGSDIVNVLQTSQNSGLCCVSSKPVSDLQALDGLRIGTWKSGFNEIARIAAEEYKISIEWVPYISGINLFVKHAVDAILTYSYNELIQLYYATGELNPDNILRFADLGYNYPEDGLYVTGKYLKNNRDTVEKFCRASIKGWLYASAHREEALDMVMKMVSQNNISTSRSLQKKMLDEVIRLQCDSQKGTQTFSPISREVFDDMVSKARNCGVLMGEIQYDNIFRK